MPVSSGWIPEAADEQHTGLHHPWHREPLPHEPPSEQTTADQKDCLFSEVITTGAGKENRERSHPSHLSAYNPNLGGSWHGPAEGNEVGCSCVGHQRNQEGSCAARGKKR